MIKIKKLRTQHRNEMFDFTKVEDKRTKTRKSHYVAFKSWLKAQKFNDELCPKAKKILKSKPQK